MREIIYSAAAGLLSGMAASMGLGGGTVLLIYLTAIAGVDQLNAQGINLIFFLPIALLSVLLHSRKKLIDWKTAISMSLLGLCGCFIGWYISNIIDETWLRKGFAAIVLIIGVRQLVFPKRREGRH